MSSVDERTVKMQFDNAQFKKGAAETQKSLADVNKAVDSTGKSKGLLDLNSNMEKVAVTASKMQVITTTALATIANKATNVALNMAKSLTFEPLKQGFSEYESMLTKQNVIQNATGKSAKVVKGILNQLNSYSDKTIYSFGNMTDAITKFVNAGVPLDKSVTSIKGIANAAAFAGASSEEANRAMYAFSQSMSLGFVGLQDWMQIENANMGTVRFKQSLIDAGVAAGTLTKKGNEYITASGKAVSATKGWRDGLQEQWATTEVLNKALGKYADRSTNLGKKAFAAAQQVRTFSAFMDTLKESIGSGWSQIFTVLIGNLGQSTKMWTGLSNSVSGVVKTFFNFATTTLKVWRHMGGFEKTVQGFKNLLAPFAALLDAIGDAWSAAFPDSGKGAGKALYGLSAGFEALTRPLQWLATLISHLVGPLTLFFSAIRVGGQIIGRVIGDVKDFVTHLVSLGDIKMPAGGGILGYVKAIGTAITDALKKVGDLIAKGASLKDALGSFSIDLPGLPDMSNPLAGAKAPSGGASALSGVGDQAQAVGSKVLAVFAKMGEGLTWIKDQLAKFFDNFTAEDVMASFNLAVLATMSLSISRFLNAITGSITSFAGSGKLFKEVLGSAGEALKSFQTQARAKLILNIAIAIGILAAALWVLSKIPADKLATGLTAMGALFVMINITMKNFMKTLKATDGLVKGVNMVAMATSIAILGAAMILLATAFLIMNKVEWKSIAKGITTMAVAMKLMGELGNLSKGAARNMVGGAVAIGLVAASMIVLAGALLLFKLVDWGSIGKAGVVLLGLTLAVGALAMIPYQGIAKVGAALLLASVGMIAMANALILFALVKWEAIGKAAVVLTLLTISLAVLMAVGGPASVAAMLGLAGAMVGLALACLIFNKVDWESIAKATLVLTVLLAALAIGAVIMTAFLYAIAPVSPVLIILAAGFALLGVGMLAFAAAMAIAITLGAAGVAAFAALATGAAVAIAVFLQTLALQAPIMKKSFLAILQNLIDTIVEAVPMIIQGIKDLWKAVKKEFTSPDKGKDAGEAGKSWIQKIGDGIKSKIPLIGEKAKEIAAKFIGWIDDHLDEFLTLGLHLIGKFLEGLSKRMPEVGHQGANLIIAMINAVAKEAPRLADAGAQAVIDFLNALAKVMRTREPEIMQAWSNLGQQMVLGLIEGIGQMFSQALGKIGDLAQGMVDKAKSILHIFSPSRVFRDIGKFLVEGLTNGIQENAVNAITAVASMVGGQIAVASAYVSKFVQGLDQQAIAARARADGLAMAASKAAQAAERQQKLADAAERKANKTKKDKSDDKRAAAAGRRADAAASAAHKIDSAAAKADRKATAAEEASAKAAEKAERQREFERSTLFEQAQMRSEDAQTAMDDAKDAERRAAADLAAANALDRQAKAKGVSKAEKKKLEAEADRLRKRAKATAGEANTSLEAARTAAADALVLQRKAGEEAALAFQQQYDAAAKADKDAAEFDKLTETEKAAKRREQAAVLQAQADKDLADAKKLAMTDLDAANDLAQVALDTAQQARDYLDEAAQHEATAAQGTGDSPGTVVTTPTGTVNLDPTEAASLAFNRYADTYDQAVAAAATGGGVEFNQYITSPDPADPVEVYRRTNNLLDFAAVRLTPAA
jgi:tape measure domain-containing protein